MGDRDAEGAAEARADDEAAAEGARATAGFLGAGAEVAGATAGRLREAAVAGALPGLAAAGSSSLRDVGFALSAALLAARSC